METYIQISKINDFVFCPRSVYLHSIYEGFNEKTYHDTPQQVGRINHQTIDQKTYSTSKHILQGMAVYSGHYGLAGKIDIYDEDKKTLIERKTKIKRIYDGYRYQLYAQYFCLKETGYKVEKMFLRSLADNKNYEILLPDAEEIRCFEWMLYRIKTYDILRDKSKKNPAKCAACIYNNLCG